MKSGGNARVSKGLFLIRWRVENEFIGVASKGFCFEPGGPTEAGGVAQARRRHFIGVENKLHIPKEVLAAIVEHPIFDAFEGIALGQHALVVGEIHRSEFHAKAKLTIPEARAKNCIYAEAAAIGRFTQAADAVGGKVQPAASKGLHLSRDVKIFA